MTATGTNKATEAVANSNVKSGGLGGGSYSKMLALQIRGPVFGPHNSHQKSRCGGAV